MIQTNPWSVSAAARLQVCPTCGALCPLGSEQDTTGVCGLQIKAVVSMETGPTQTGMEALVGPDSPPRFRLFIHAEREDAAANSWFYVQTGPHARWLLSWCAADTCWTGVVPHPIVVGITAVNVSTAIPSSYKSWILK